jgi:hypothetical protein
MYNIRSVNLLTKTRTLDLPNTKQKKLTFRHIYILLLSELSTAKRWTILIVYGDEAVSDLQIQGIN